MGPITLFDKSFLQSLSLDEAVWFDKFFYPVICPIFYVETLADLAKSQDKRSAEAEVRIIAEKTPELSGGPCLFHQTLAAYNLLGHEVPMDSTIPRPGGRYVSGGGRIGVVYDESPEMEAFGRWQDEKFLDVERLFAMGWRTVLEDADLYALAKILRDLGVDEKRCISLQQAKDMAQEIVNGSSNPYTRLALAIRFFQIPQQYHSELRARWDKLLNPTLSSFAPYAAYVLTVEMFFHISIAANLISSERASNRTDIAYLFYLPFCMMFVSSDKLHRRIANLFLRSDQDFVWGFDLKDDLRKLNTHYLTLPAEKRDQGIIRMVGHPPIEGEYLTTSLWRRWMSDEAFSEPDYTNAIDSENSQTLAGHLTDFVEGQTLSASQIPKTAEEVESMGIRRRVHRRKGSWYFVPKDLPDTTLE